MRTLLFATTTAALVGASGAMAWTSVDTKAVQDLLDQGYKVGAIVRDERACETEAGAKFPCDTVSVQLWKGAALFECNAASGVCRPLTVGALDDDNID